MKWDLLKKYGLVIGMRTERWSLSLNVEDIGVLYLMFTLISGLLKTTFSVFIRKKLEDLGVHYIAYKRFYFLEKLF